jgi:hypothetical protein
MPIALVRPARDVTNAARRRATLRGTNRAVIFVAGPCCSMRSGAPIGLFHVMHHLKPVSAALLQAGLAADTPAARDRFGDAETAAARWHLEKNWPPLCAAGNRLRL